MEPLQGLRVSLRNEISSLKALRAYGLVAGGWINLVVSKYGHRGLETRDLEAYNRGQVTPSKHRPWLCGKASRGSRQNHGTCKTVLRVRKRRLKHTRQIARRS